MRILSAASMIRPLAVLAMVGMLSQAAIRDAAAAITVTSLGLYNTGKSAANVNLIRGSAAASDPHYTLIAAPAPVLTNNPTGKVNATDPAGPWLANNVASQWITPQQFASPPSYPGDPAGWPDSAPSPGTYRYKTTFTVAPGQVPYLEIAGRWATDNTGTLYLNGNLVSTSPTFTSWTNFILSSGFVAGNNTLWFDVVNTTTLTTGNPTGLRAEFLSAAVPEPASLVGWGLILGAVSVGTWFKRRRTQSR